MSELMHTKAGRGLLKLLVATEDLSSETSPEQHILIDNLRNELKPVCGYEHHANKGILAEVESEVKKERQDIIDRMERQRAIAKLCETTMELARAAEKLNNLEAMHRDCNKTDPPDAKSRPKRKKQATNEDWKKSLELAGFYEQFIQVEILHKELKDLERSERNHDWLRQTAETEQVWAKSLW